MFSLRLPCSTLKPKPHHIIQYHTKKRETTGLESLPTQPPQTAILSSEPEPLIFASPCPPSDACPATDYLALALALPKPCPQSPITNGSDPRLATHKPLSPTEHNCAVYSSSALLALECTGCYVLSVLLLPTCSNGQNPRIFAVGCAAIASPAALCHQNSYPCSLQQPLNESRFHAAREPATS